jgi:hypothetical protein
MFKHNFPPLKPVVDKHDLRTLSENVNDIASGKIVVRQPQPLVVCAANVVSLAANASAASEG